MIIEYGTHQNAAELITKLAKAPIYFLPQASEAIYEYLLELLDEEILEAQQYSALSEILYSAFWEAACDINRTIKIDGCMLLLTDAIELVDKTKAAATVEEEIRCECDIGLFIDRLHRDVKLGIAEEIELDFYRRWLSRTLFGRTNFL